MGTHSDIPAPMSVRQTVRAYLELIRAPNVFTAAADVCMGFFFVRGGLALPGMLALLVGASCLLYMAGMVLNDVQDHALDLQERPHRPIPSGRISLPTARRCGYALLAGGVLLGWAAGFAFPENTWPAQCGIIATCLAVAIVLYDGGLKTTPAAPLAMGACRMLNVLLGMSGSPHSFGGWELAGFDGGQWLVAGGIGLYIAGVTWFARTEAKRSQMLPLAWGLSVMTGGIALLALFPLVGDYAQKLHFNSAQFALAPEFVWMVLLALLSFTIFRRCLSAIYDPAPVRVQAAVKQSILSLIVLDGAITLAIAGPLNGFFVLLLLAPTIFLGRWIYST